MAIHQRRVSGEYDPERTRAEFVNLYRWRIQKVLGYKTTHALQLGNVSDQPVYTMIFATDVAAGHSIMGDVYDHALMHEIPQLRAHAVGVRTAKRDLEKGSRDSSCLRMSQPRKAMCTSSRGSRLNAWAQSSSSTPSRPTTIWIRTSPPDLTGRVAMSGGG